MSSASKYHLSANGDPNPCGANVQRCPLTDKHFIDSKEARQYYEEKVTKGLSIPKKISGDDKDYSSYDIESEQFVDSLNPPAKRFIEDYVNQEYENVNRSLWNDEEVEGIAEANKALSKRSEIKSLWRKPATHHQGLGNVKVGDTIDLKGFTSTSVNPNVMLPLMVTEADKYASEVPSDEWETEESSYCIKVPDEYMKKEPNVVFQFITDMGKPVSSLSHMPQEKEVLLPSGTQWKVVAIKKERDFSSSKRLSDDSEWATRSRRAVVYQLMEAS